MTALRTVSQDGVSTASVMAGYPVEAEGVVGGEMATVVRRTTTN